MALVKCDVSAQEVILKYQKTTISSTKLRENNFNGLWDLDKRAWAQERSVNGGEIWRIVGNHVVLDATN